MFSIYGADLNVTQRDFTGPATVRILELSNRIDKSNLVLRTRFDMKREIAKGTFAKCRSLTLSLSSGPTIRCADLETFLEVLLDSIGPQIGAIHLYDLPALRFVVRCASMLTRVSHLTMGGCFQKIVPSMLEVRTAYNVIGDLLATLPPASLLRVYFNYGLTDGPKREVARCSTLLSRFPLLEKMSSNLYFPPVSNAALKEIVVAYGTLYTRARHHHWEDVLVRMRGAPALETFIISADSTNSTVMREHVIRMEGIVREYVRLCPRAKSLKSGHLDYDGPIRHLQGLLTILGAQYKTQAQRACVVHRVPADIFRVVKRFLDLKPIHALGDVILF